MSVVWLLLRCFRDVFVCVCFGSRLSANVGLYVCYKVAAATRHILYTRGADAFTGTCWLKTSSILASQHGA